MGSNKYPWSCPLWFWTPLQLVVPSNTALYKGIWSDFKRVLCLFWNWQGDQLETSTHHEFVLQVNCLEAVCRGLETLFVYVCERATDMVYNVCLLRKVATEIAVLPWVVEMSCFDMPCLPYKKTGEKKRHCRHQKTAQLISHFCAGSVVRWCHRQWSNYYP